MAAMLLKPLMVLPTSTAAGSRSRIQAFGNKVLRKTTYISARRTSVLALPAQGGGQGLAETAALDQLIDMLMAAKGAEELAQLVAQNIMSYDQRFWLRLATRSDTASSTEEKERLGALAKVVMQLVDAMVKKTEGQLSDSADLLQKILTAAADGRGEWQVPLSPDKLQAMKKVMEDNSDRLDEALLSNAFAWLRKSSEDKMDGMVALLQKVLQLYASRQLSQQQAGQSSSSGTDALDAALSELLAADESQWAALLRQHAQKDGVSEPALLEALQRRMEGVVLGLSSGSYGQRVCAEYLKELENRAKAVFQELARS
ncbi:hypothetical protein N2152v2_009774 [Parachlorella kessleri]